MPTKPKIQNLAKNATSVNILNTIRKNATQYYKDYIPKATKAPESVKEIGGIIMDYPALQNEFLSALVNRIGMVIITSKMYDNPLSVFKRGLLELGETVEEIFVELAKPFEYDVETSEKEVFKREIPKVLSAFHTLNYKKFYKVTVQQNELRQAFLSWDGITDLITKIINNLYSAAAYDEFQTMKYMIAKQLLNGRMYPITIPEVSKENIEDIVTEIKGTSNDMEFMSNKYTITGVRNFNTKNEQYLIVNSKFDAKMDVNVLASAFNMNKAEFLGHKILVDGFGSLDIERLNDLFKNDPTYTEIGQSDLDALNQIPAIIVSENYFMIFDNLNEMTEIYNGQGLYWNYFYHQWKIFSISPFENNAMFIPDVPEVTSVTVTPETANVSKGQSLQLVAVVQTSGFAPQSVTWEVTSGENVTVDSRGLVTIGNDATGEIIITAKSTYNTEKTGTCTITVS